MIAVVDPGLATIVAAGLAMCGAIIGGAIQLRRLRQENTEQHYRGQIANSARWDLVMKEVGSVGGKVDATRTEVLSAVQKVDKRVDDLDSRVTDVETCARWERAELLAHVDPEAV